MKNNDKFFIAVFYTHKGLEKFFDKLRNAQAALEQETIISNKIQKA